jgi:hypothetical protein
MGRRHDNKENEILTENIHDSTSFIACQTKIWRLALNGFGVGTLALCLKKEASEKKQKPVAVGNLMGRQTNVQD